MRTSDARGLTQHHAVLTPDSKRAWLNGYLVLPAETDTGPLPLTAGHSHLDMSLVP